MAAADDCTMATAADIICSLRFADLGGWAPPWEKQQPASGYGDGDGDDVAAGVLIWPAMARGKRSRRSPAASAAAAKGRWARASPASPLDYSGGSGSGASTSCGEEGACSPEMAAAGIDGGGHRHVGPSGVSKVRSGARQPLVSQVQPTRPIGQRPRKKMRLPEIQQLVASLTVANQSLREEMALLKRACAALSDENCKLESRLDQSSVLNGIASQMHEGKQLCGASPSLDQDSPVQSPQEGFVLPDLNLPAEEDVNASMS